jgi:hypothetical protein
MTLFSLAMWWSIFLVIRNVPIHFMEDGGIGTMGKVPVLDYSKSYTSGPSCRHGSDPNHSIRVFIPL